MKTFFYILLLLVLPLTAQAQDITQTLKGTIYDQNTHEPLIGATVVVQNSDPVIGTTTDEKGHFSLPNLRLGRVSLEVSYIGYDSQTIPEVLITSAKEVVLNIALREAFTELEGVEIVAGIRKEKALNTMATVSARTFSVEETQRYAGGLSDPARLASAFAGVSTGNLQDNSIIVRGNAPQGVQWRLEGVEIPSPQHFSACDGAVALIVDKIAKREDSGERGQGLGVRYEDAEPKSSLKINAAGTFSLRRSSCIALVKLWVPTM